MASTPTMVEGDLAQAKGAEIALRVAEVHKHFGDVVAVDGVSVDVCSGEFVTLLGPSGCGKTTLMRMIAGIETPTAGTIAIQSRVVSDPAGRVNVPPERRNLGMVFQSYAVWPHMTVAQNVAYPLRRRKVAAEQRRKEVAAILAAVQLQDLEDRYPGQLSGGQQQRVAFARAVVHAPSVLLLDEPLSNLDAQLRDEMRIELKRLQVEFGLTVLYVTHDQSEALALSDRILVMNAGSVIQEGTPEEVYRRPATLQTAKFLGFKNILPGVFAGEDELLCAGHVLRRAVMTGTPPESGAHVKVGIRPDKVVHVSEGDGIEGTIEIVAFIGNGYEYQVDVGEDRKLVAFATARPGEPGERVRLNVEPGGAIILPEADPPKPDGG